MPIMFCQVTNRALDEPQKKIGTTICLGIYRAYERCCKRYLFSVYNSGSYLKGVRQVFVGGLVLIRSVVRIILKNEKSEILDYYLE